MVASVSLGLIIYRERPPTFCLFILSGPEPLYPSRSLQLLSGTLYLSYPNILGEERTQINQYGGMRQRRKGFEVKGGVNPLTC